jgi:hypothetical protein
MCWQSVYLYLFNDILYVSIEHKQELQTEDWRTALLNAATQRVALQHEARHLRVHAVPCRVTRSHVFAPVLVSVVLFQLPVALAAAAVISTV